MHCMSFLRHCHWYYDNAKFVIYCALLQILKNCQITNDEPLLNMTIWICIRIYKLICFNITLFFWPVFLLTLFVIFSRPNVLCCLQAQLSPCWGLCSKMFMFRWDLVSLFKHWKKCVIELWSHGMSIFL